MGLETEYGISAGSGARDSLEALVISLIEAARATLVHLPDIASGMYLGNGSRFYIDYGNHPELSTPECANPWDLVRYILAGERILAGVARDSRIPEASLRLFKSNVDYSGSMVTWGCHESYMHRAAPYTLSDDVVPHLVTRTIYTGAGGFNSLSAGLDFTLSPRVPHLSSVQSGNSTADRGIFHTKDEPLSKEGFHRLHIICGESLCSEKAMWLKAGTTALVVALSEAGLEPGAGVRLRSPLQAMQAISSDQTCSISAETDAGRRLSALEIQYHYLTMAEQNLDHPRMPAWAEAVCREWRTILNQLLDQPESLTNALDWAIKRALYSSYARSRGVGWDTLYHWTPVLSDLRYIHNMGTSYNLPFTAELILDPRGPFRDTVSYLTPQLDQSGLSWESLDSVITLRKELMEIDTRFGELGGCGLFAELGKAGVLAHHVPGVDAIDDAMINPPQFGRARIRGEVIRRLAGNGGGYRVDWQGIADLRNNRLLNLSDPFETNERWSDTTKTDAPLPQPFIDIANWSWPDVDSCVG
jgi:Pup-ligase protein